MLNLGIWIYHIDLLDVTSVGIFLEKNFDCSRAPTLHTWHGSTRWPRAARAAHVSSPSQGLAGLVSRRPDSGQTPADFQTHWSPSFFTHFLRILYQIEALRVYYHVGLVLGPKNYEISPCKNQRFGQLWNPRSRRPNPSNERPRASLGPHKACCKLEFSWNTTFYVRMNSTSKMEVRDPREIEGFTS